MGAARGLVGVIATSIAALEERVTLPQLRVLVLADGDGPLTLPAVAAELGVHASNATRICDRLVVAGLLDRRDNPADRRQVHLALTRRGRDLLAEVIDHRRRTIAAVLARLDGPDRDAVASALAVFAAAARDVGGADPMALSWA
jgi:DNA-binding MarR family transcriptional regulator